MDLGKAFTYFTEDEDWIKKLAIGAGIVFASWIVAIPILILYGYELAVTRNVLNGEEKPLPAWDDFGTFFMDGLMITIARLIYSLPLLLLMCLGFGVAFLPALAAGNDDAVAILGGLSAIVWVGLACLILIFSIGLTLLYPAINIQYLRHGSLAACLRFSEVIATTREYIGDVVMILIGLIAAGLVVALLTSILSITICGAIIVMLVGPVWIRMMSGHLIGQLMQKTDGKGAELAPV